MGHSQQQRVSRDLVSYLVQRIYESDEHRRGQTVTLNSDWFAEIKTACLVRRELGRLPSAWSPFYA